MNLSSRQKIFHQAHDANKKIALYYADNTDSAPFRYRCYNTMQATLNSKKWQAVYFTKNELDFVETLLGKSNLLIIERQSSHDSTAKNLIQKASELNLPVIFDLDDLVFHTKYVKDIMHSVGGKNYPYWYLYTRGVNKIARQADGFITTNDFLGKKLSENFRKPYQIILNSLNNEQIEISNRCLKDKKTTPPFKMGYFSGSPTHAKDFELIAPEIFQFLKDHQDAILRVVGFMDFPKEANYFLKNKQIVFQSPVDYIKLQRLMSEVDVNIAPLVDNIFTNCKSELKFFEAAAVETTTIASPIYTFKNAIQNGKTGFLCQPGEWYDTLEYLYNNPAKNRLIAKAARKYCLEHYTGSNFLKEIESAYDYFAK